MQALSELVDLSLWDRAAAEARDRASNVEKSFNDAYNRTQILAQEHVSTSVPTEDEIYAADAKLDAINAAMATASATVDCIKSEVVRLNAVYTSMAAEESALQSKHRQAVAAENELEQKYRFGSLVFMPKREEARQAVSDLAVASALNEIQSRRNELHYINSELEQLLGDSGMCPKCHSIVDSGHLTRERLSLLDAVDEAKERTASAEAALVPIRMAYESAVAAAHTKVDEEETAWKMVANKVWQDQVAVRLAIGNNINNVARARADTKSQLDRALQQQNTVRDEYTTLIGHQAEQRVVIERMSQAINKQQHTGDLIKVWNDRATSFKTDLEYLKALDRAFGDKGIKAYKLNEVIAALNQLIHKNLAVLTGGQIQVWVDAFRNKRTDGDLVADVRVYVREGDKKTVPIECYSGGEVEQISLAIVCAMWNLATHYGGGTNLLLLDETFKFLDEQSVAMVMDLLNEVKASDTKTIILITHDLKIQNLLQFDQVWTAVKDSSITHIEAI
jgi:DNA repair exonuclease SbcCD ATPase subunit